MLTKGTAVFLPSSSVVCTPTGRTFVCFSCGKVRKLGMMAGGTGITPMLQVISAVMREGSSSSSSVEMSLIFANKSEDDILLRDMIEKLVRAGR